MQLNLRTLAPALVVVTLALAGCKTAPTKTSDAAATPQAGQQSTAPATATRVDFYLAKREPGPGLREVSLPDGKLYLQETPVLTRADLTDADLILLGLTLPLLALPVELVEAILGSLQLAAP